MRSICILILFAILPTFSLAKTPKTKTTKKKVEKKINKDLLTRIDFGNSYISGQTLKSGAVYLLHRKKSEIQSMLKPRKNFREEIKAENHDFKLNQEKKQNEN